MKEKLILAAFLMATALPAFSGDPGADAGGNPCLDDEPPPECFVDDSVTELPEPSTIGLFLAAAIGITVLRKLKK